MLKTSGAGPHGAAAAPSTQAVAAAVWSELQWRGVPPTPRNYMLWFTYRAGGNPGLNKRMSKLLDPGQPLSPDSLDTLYEEYLAGRNDAAGAAEGSAGIEDAARTLIDQLANSQSAAEAYGHILAHWEQALGTECTQDGLLRAVTTLATETGRAAERNRVLQEQLTAATSRITRLRQSLSAVKQETVTDALTGIANRKAFDDALRRMIRKARSDAFEVAVLLVDIDHFKAFNDIHGHRTGDLVLRLVARVLAENVKSRDCAARYGGEEFGIILADSDLVNAVGVAQRINERLAKTKLMLDAEKGPCGVTVSTGVALHRPPETIAAFMERADQAMYEAKRRGRNQVCVAAE